MPIQIELSDDVFSFGEQVVEYGDDHQLLVRESGTLLVLDSNDQVVRVLAPTSYRSARRIPSP